MIQDMDVARHASDTLAGKSGHVKSDFCHLFVARKALLPASLGVVFSNVKRGPVCHPCIAAFR